MHLKKKKLIFPSRCLGVSLLPVFLGPSKKTLLKAAHVVFQELTSDKQRANNGVVLRLGGNGGPFWE